MVSTKNSYNHLGHFGDGLVNDEEPFCLGVILLPVDEYFILFQCMYHSMPFDFLM